MKKIDKNELHELFSGLKNKNQNSYNKLYEKYYSLVYGIVFSILKNKEDSEDVSHEIFTKIYKMPVDKLPINNEASWLYTVSKNESFLHLRKSNPNISIEEVYEIPSDSSDIDKVIDSEFYNKAMAGLKEDEKMIISLKVLSDFTFQKIAQIMDIPIGTVQWKYYKAINSLKISIGSLVGAVIAFIMVFASGGLRKKEEYFNKSKDNKQGADNQQNANMANETPSGENETTKQQQLDNTSTITKEEVEQATIVNEMPAEKENINAAQIVFASIGIVFLIIFVIFFKKYQQKLKRKSSK